MYKLYTTSEITEHVIDEFTAEHGRAPDLQDERDQDAVTRMVNIYTQMQRAGWYLSF